MDEQAMQGMERPVAARNDRWWYDTEWFSMLMEEPYNAWCNDRTEEIVITRHGLTTRIDAHALQAQWDVRGWRGVSEYVVQQMRHTEQNELNTLNEADREITAPMDEELFATVPMNETEEQWARPVHRTVTWTPLEEVPIQQRSVVAAMMYLMWKRLLITDSQWELIKGMQQYASEQEHANIIASIADGDIT